MNILNYKQMLTNEQKKKLSMLCYKINLTIEPNWKKILESIAPKKENEDKHSQFIDKIIEEIKKNPKNKIDLENSLLGKSFRFVYFYNGFSGMEQIWCDWDKTFLDDIEIRGKILDTSMHFTEYKEFNEKYGKDFSDKLTGRLLITPSYIGFPRVSPDNDIMDEEKLSTIPYYEILYLFIQIYLRYNHLLCGDILAIKTFPIDFQEEFNKANIKYNIKFSFENCELFCVDPNKEVIKFEALDKIGVELYNQRMHSHLFESPHYSLWIDIKFFESATS